MRAIDWRAIAWAALALGLLSLPLSAAPPKGSSSHAGKGNSGTSAGGAGHGTVIGRNAGTTSSQNAGAGTGKNSNAVNGRANGYNANGNKKANSPLGLLREARHEIGGSHFAYGGHRTNAMKEVDRAIKELTPPNPNAGQQTGQAQPQQHTSTKTQVAKQPAQNSTPRPKVEQTLADSNSKLQRALNLLTRAYGAMDNSNPDAATNVAGAMKELRLALNIE